MGVNYITIRNSEWEWLPVRLATPPQDNPCTPWTPLADSFTSTLQTAAKDETPKVVTTKRAWVNGDIRQMLFCIPQMAGLSLSSVAESTSSMMLLRACRIKAFGPGNS